MKNIKSAKAGKSPISSYFLHIFFIFFIFSSYFLHFLHISHFLEKSFKLFKEIEKLTEIQMKFSLMLGIPISEDLKEWPLNPISRSRFASSRNQPADSYKDPVIPARKPAPQNQSLMRYRLMIYLQSLNELPGDIDLKRNYFVEYTLFDQKMKYKLDLANLQKKGKQIYLPINKVKVFYLFAHERKAVSDFFYAEKVFFSIFCIKFIFKKSLSFRLFFEQKKVGVADLELNDFTNETSITREYFKYFSGKELLPILSWGLSVPFIHKKLKKSSFSRLFSGFRKALRNK